MRTIHYHIVNKTTHKPIFIHCSKAKCQEYFEKLANKDNFYLCHKWVSI